MNGIIDKIERLESFNLRNSVGRKALNSLTFITDIDALNEEYDWISKVGNVVNDVMEHALCEIQDIEGTIHRLANGEVLDDVQLYEIKHLAIVAAQVRNSGADWLENLSEVVTILDPNEEGIDTFYIYDSYDEQLAKMRRAWKEPTAEQFAAMSEVEDRVRKRLSRELKIWSTRLHDTLTELGLLDLRIAKWQMAEAENLTRPHFSADSSTTYRGLFNIETRNALKSKGKNYQAVDVKFGNYPTIVTGMNMGGKTVLLKSLVAAQELCQYGFFVPAAEAEVMIVDEVLLSIDDSQNHLSGLSSFAAEMLTVDSIIKTTERERKVLVLIDELARTTNPVEGRIIVSKVVERLKQNGVPSFVTTHYDGIHGDYRRLRVKGLKENSKIADISEMESVIDYSLVETTEEEVPREALRVAEMLGIKLFL